MINNNRGRVRRAAMMLLVTLSGGTTFVSCDMRVRQTFVNGTKAWFYSLLDPSLFLSAFQDQNQ